MTEPSDSLLARVRAWSSSRGLNLVGIVDADAFDRTQPAGRRARDLAGGCGSILVLGSGGRGCWDFLRGVLGAALDEPRDGHDPIDDWSGRVAAELLVELRAGEIGAGELGEPGTVVRPNDARTLNFVQLAEMAGLGTVSPVIHQLLHPEFGPWVSLRAALLLPGKPAESTPPASMRGFQPCDGCARPCVDACPAAVYSASSAPRFDACAERRLGGGCADGCEVRRACPIGQPHRYGAAEEAFRHAYSLFTMRRCARRGLWQRLAAALRPRRHSPESR